MKDEGFNDPEDLLLFTLAVGENRSAETDREVWQGENVESPDVLSVMNSDTECRVAIPFLQGCTAIEEKENDVQKKNSLKNPPRPRLARAF